MKDIDTKKECIWLEMIRWTAQMFATQLLHHVIAKLATNCVQNVAQKHFESLNHATGI